MAREIHKFGVTVPAGTLPTAPQVSPLTMPPCIVDQVTVIVPSGTRGLVGFALGAAGRAFIPYEPGQFFVTDDEIINWPLEGQITSGAWQLFAYNTGQYNHAIEVRFLTRIPGELLAGVPTSQLDSGALGSGPTAPEPPPGVTPPDVGSLAAPPSIGASTPSRARETLPVLTATPAPARGPTPPAAPTLATVGFRQG